MPLLETKGAASSQGFGLTLGSNVPTYIEDVFSTWLYTGNNATQTITNGINLSGRGGMVWTKSRNEVFSHYIVDTVRGVTKGIASNATGSETTDLNSVTAFGTTGYTIGDLANINSFSPRTYVSWTFREQTKFFDIVTWTGNGVANRAIPHNLGSEPGCIIIKRTDTTSFWPVYHRSTGTGKYTFLNTTDSVFTNSATFTSVTSTTFTPVGSPVGSLDVNTNGGTYVAYLFAHDAGGFGLSGTDNVISCGSYTGNGTNVGPTITLGYEPQWVMVKRSSAAGTNWYIIDNMRGFNVVDSNGNALLQPNTSAAETSTNPGGTYMVPTATGFQIRSTDGEVNSNGQTYIYIAIRRGPMKVPTTGTSVFAPVIGNSSSSAPFTGWNTSFTVDGVIYQARAGSTGFEESRLQGSGRYLQTASTAAEVSGGASQWDRQTGLGLTTNNNVSDYIGWMYRRAPGFFDVVCYTGTGSARTVAHNLGVAPELIIVKPRNSALYDWNCYHVSLGNTKYIALNTALADSSAVSLWNNTTPTLTVFSVSHPAVNDSGGTYVAYLFASCPGVSKVGSYTGTGTTQTINCGFTAGSRFVLIKRTDSTGDWYVWDSARGIVSGNDPYLLLNSTAAEVTNTDFIDTAATGFEISSTAPAAINASGGTFIFLAIA